jgi:hypothetical protein
MNYALVLCAGNEGREAEVPYLDEHFIEDLICGKDNGLWALQDDLMLEEPP